MTQDHETAARAEIRTPLNFDGALGLLKRVWPKLDPALSALERQGFMRDLTFLLLDVQSASREQSGARELAAALRELAAIIEAAGLNNLANGVQLGATSWYVKASDRMDYARAVLARYPYPEPERSITRCKVPMSLDGSVECGVPMPCLQHYPEPESREEGTR